MRLQNVIGATSQFSVCRTHGQLPRENKSYTLEYCALSAMLMAHRAYTALRPVAGADATTAYGYWQGYRLANVTFASRLSSKIQQHSSFAMAFPLRNTSSRASTPIAGLLPRRQDPAAMSQEDHVESIMPRRKRGFPTDSDGIANAILPKRQLELTEGSIPPAAMRPSVSRPLPPTSTARQRAPMALSSPQSWA